MASGSNIGWCRFKTVPSSQKSLQDSAGPDMTKSRGIPGVFFYDRSLVSGSIFLTFTKLGCVTRSTFFLFFENEIPVLSFSNPQIHLPPRTPFFTSRTSPSSFQTAVWSRPGVPVCLMIIIKHPSHFTWYLRGHKGLSQQPREGGWQQAGNASHR